MRLGFAVAAHIDADVLLLDEVFAVGDEEFQRKCFGKIFEFKQRGGTIVFVSHDAPAVERLCDRAVLLRDGQVEFDGPTHEAIVALPAAARRASATPRSAAAGLTRVGQRRGADRGVRAARRRRRRATQFLAGEPLAVRLRVAARAAARAAAALVRAARRRGRCSSPAARRRPPSSAGATARASAQLRFDVDSLPFADGRFHLRLRAHRRRAASSCYHWLDDALRFVVYPAGEARGVVLLDGRWSVEEIGAQAKGFAR